MFKRPAATHVPLIPSYLYAAECSSSPLLQKVAPLRAPPSSPPSILSRGFLLPFSPGWAEQLRNASTPFLQKSNWGESVAAKPCSRVRIREKNKHLSQGKTVQWMHHLTLTCFEAEKKFVGSQSKVKKTTENSTTIFYLYLYLYYSIYILSIFYLYLD